MPRTNDPGKYPQAYHKLLQDVALEGKTIRVPAVGAMPDDESMPGMQRALKLRAHFYAFIGSLKRARATSQENGRWNELADYANRTMVYLDKKAVALMFVPRENSWQQKLIESGGVVSEVPKDSKAAESLDKFKEMLESGDLS